MTDKGQTMSTTSTSTKISRSEAIELLKSHREKGKGKIFSVSFTSRGDGQRRDMQARFEVKSHLKGGKQRYNPADQALMTVFDMAKGDYRNINLLGLLEVTIKGQRYEVK
jgi:hypothetical protein